MLEAALQAVGRSVATIGTLGLRALVPLDAVSSTITTPESPDLQALLAVMVEVDAVAMEVSSHALALHRTDSIGFDVAGFTHAGPGPPRFPRRHRGRLAAKTRLFLGGARRVAVVPADDPWGRRLADLVGADGRPRLVTTSADGTPADYRVTASEALADGGSRVTLAHPGGEVASRCRCWASSTSATP